MLRASVTTVVTSALLALTSFLNAAVTARGLGVDGRGTLAAALLVVAVGRVLGLMGLGDAVVRAFGQQQVLSSVRRVLVGVLAIAALAGLTIGMLGVSITPLRGEGWPLLLMVVLWTGLGAMLDLLIAIARVQPSLSIFNFIRLAAPTLATSVTALVYFIDGLTVAVVLLVQVVTTVFSMVWATHSLSRVLKDSVLLEERPKNVDISLRGLARAGAGYQWIAMLGLVVTHGHLGIVMTVGSLHALGLYSAVFGLSRMIAPVQMSIGSAVFAASAQDLGSSSASGTLRAYRLSTALMLSIGVCVAANASWMVPLILGEPFRSGAVAFAILTIECVVSGAAYVLGQHLQAAGAVRAVINRNALSIVPIGLGLYFLSAENVVVVMAILLLASGLVRLVATLLTFRRTHGWVQIMPVPSRNDVALMKASLVKKGK